MGSLLLMAGKKDLRFATPSARIMLHQPSGAFEGQATDIVTHAQEILDMKKRINEIYVHHTGQPPDKNALLIIEGSQASSNNQAGAEQTLEQIALQDDYFVSRKLYPNVDFYTGLIYRAMGFPTNFFTVLFAIGRLPGWIAQWREMINDPETKIGRPRQLYTGHTQRDYVPVDRR